MLATHRENDGRVMGTDSEPRRTGFRTSYWPRAGSEQIGAIQISRAPSPDPHSEAMMIRRPAVMADIARVSAATAHRCAPAG